MGDAPLEEPWQRVWRDFWTPIVVKDGEVDLEQIKRELYDFWLLAQNVSIVYDHITNGRISKPLTAVSAVLGEDEERIQRLIAEALEENKG